MGWELIRSGQERDHELGSVDTQFKVTALSPRGVKSNNTIKWTRDSSGGKPSSGERIRVLEKGHKLL